MGLLDFDWNPFEDFSVSNIIPESISMVFERIGDFINGANIFFLNIYVVFIILLFFAILIGLAWIPAKLYPLFKQHQVMLNRIIKLKA